MDAGLLHGLWTAAMLVVFAAIVVWAWSGRRRRDFEAAARLPLEEGTDDRPRPADGLDRDGRAWSGRRKRDFAAARLPLEEGTDEGVTEPRTRDARPASSTRRRRDSSTTDPRTRGVRHG